MARFVACHVTRLV